MQKYNKLIGLADRSANGWMTAQECMPDKLASDWRFKKNAPSGKEDNQKEKACIFKEIFVNVFICCSVSSVQLRKFDTPMHS